MEEDSFENLHVDLELSKHEDDRMSVNTEVPSDPWFDEEDIMSSTPRGQEDESEKDISYSCLYGKETEETKLLVEEIDLYGDLIRIEEEQMKAKRNHEIELENFKKELENLRESDVQKSAQIELLSKEKENLMRSICSLYKTVKKEIERKDELLAEANKQTRKLESILMRKNEQNPRQNRCIRCKNCNHENEMDNHTSKRKRSKSPESFINSNKRHFSSSKADTDTRLSSDKEKSNPLDTLPTRRNSESKNEVVSNSHVSTLPQSSNYTTERDCSASKSGSNEKISSDKLNKCNTDIPTSDKNFGKNKEKLPKRNRSSSPKSLNSTMEKDKFKANNSITLPSDTDHLTKDSACVLYQPPQDFNFSENSRDATETNNIFFSMLPDSLKKSFYEYEQSQVISLNKLKQSFINEYFNSDASIPSTTLECSLKTLKREEMHLKQLLFDKKSHVDAVSTSSLLTPSSEGHSSTTVTDKFERNFRDSKSNSSREKSVKTRKALNFTKSNRKDLETSSRFRKERIPFSERRKYYHRNNRNFVHKKL